MATNLGKKALKKPLGSPNILGKDEMGKIPEAEVIGDDKKNNEPDFLDLADEKRKNNDSEDIKIDSKVKSTSDTVNISGKDEDELLGILKQTSQRSEPHESKIEKDISGFKDLSREELDKKVKAIDDGGEKLSAGELFDVAMAIEEILDLVLSFIFALIAKDKGGSSEYGITKEKKMIIAKNLSMVFAKYQASIGVVTLLILSIFAAYAPAAKKSMDNRKKTTGTKTDNKGTGDNTTEEDKKPVGRPKKS